MAEGFRRAGITFDLAFDKDPNACESYERNLGHRPIEMDVRDLLKLVMAGWRPGPVRLIVADPPCTPWSRAGKRLGIADERDMLGVTCELIRLLRPRAYLIGNVPGLDDSTQWHNVQAALAPLRRAGYCIADYVSLDAADFGTPQHRIRPFWFGHLDGPCARWPQPTHGDCAHPSLPGFALKPWVTCRDALSHLPPDQLGRPCRLRKRSQNGHQHGSVLERPALVVGTSNLSDGNVLLNPKHPPATPDGCSPTNRGGGEGHSAPQVILVANPRHLPSTLDEPAKAVTGSRADRGAQGGRALRLEDPLRPAADIDAPHRTITTQAGCTALLADREHHRTDPERPARTQTSRQDDARLLDWPWTRPATTVCADERIPPPGHHPESGSIQSLPNAVILSEAAGAILQGFPEGWLFAGATKRARWSQIGQAMPPQLAEAVARSIAEQMRAADASLQVHDVAELLGGCG